MYHYTILFIQIYEKSTLKHVSFIFKTIINKLMQPLLCKTILITVHWVKETKDSASC